MINYCSYFLRNYSRILMSNSNRAKMSDETNKHGVIFDEKKIQQKMKELKQRKSKLSNPEVPKMQFMNPSVSLRTRKIKQFRQSTNTTHLLQFEDQTLQQKPTTLQITGYDTQYISVDNMLYPSSIIIVPKQVFIWEVLTVENIKLDDFCLAKYLSPKPTYLIVGINNIKQFPTPVYQALQKQFENFDVLPLFEAISQFNTTANDDINVIGFFISK